MANEKLQSLTKYAADLQSKLQSKDVPVKQKNRERQYREFLAKDLKMTMAKIDSIRLSDVPAGKK